MQISTARAETPYGTTRSGAAAEAVENIAHVRRLDETLADVAEDNDTARRLIDRVQP